MPFTPLTQLPDRPVTRFAPAPTGYLHLGHVVNAVFVWGIARARHGTVLLRIEDHDRKRCQLEYEMALLEDLDWLGLEPDAGTSAELRAGPSPHRQRDRESLYLEALARLERSQQVYACDCSRKGIAFDGGDVPNEETRYGGRCRGRGLSRAAGRGLRVVIDDGDERFVDAALGAQTQIPARQCGDLLVRDRLGRWTYQFAVTVDDLEQGVNLVIRGRDLLASTGRQIWLARMLGRAAPPVFLHHPLIVKPGGEKLSKASHDTGIRELRAAGMTPGQVLGRAAFLAGIVAAERPLSVEALGDPFRE